MKKISLLFMAICSFCFTSCLSDLDNYEAPNGGISGRILDAETNEPIPLPVQGSTGVIINMLMILSVSVRLLLMVIALMIPKKWCHDY